MSEELTSPDGTRLDQSLDQSGQRVVRDSQPNQVRPREHLCRRNQRDTWEQRLGAQAAEITDPVASDDVVTGARERGREHRSSSAGADDSHVQARRR